MAQEVTAVDASGFGRADGRHQQQQSQPLFPAQIPHKPDQRHRTWQMSPQLTLSGFSRCKDKTCLRIPQMKLCLDAGDCQDKAAEYVFITHGHNDHAYNADYMCARYKATLFCPVECVPFIEQRVRSFIEVGRCSFQGELNGKWTITGVAPEEKFCFGKNDLYGVEVWYCHHPVPCVGYGFSERRQKLLPELRGKSGREIGLLRKTGRPVTQLEETKLFAFLGDTSIEVFETSPGILEYPVVIVECTFLDDEKSDPEEFAKLTEKCSIHGHTMWSQLKPVVLCHPETTFCLIHFSLKYSDEDIRAYFLKEAESAWLGNVVVFGCIGDST